MGSDGIQAWHSQKGTGTVAVDAGQIFLWEYSQLGGLLWPTKQTFT